MDYRLINTPEEIENVLHKLEDLHVVKYSNRISNKDEIDIITQELQVQYPELCAEAKGYTLHENQKLVPVLVKAIQELHQELKAVKKELKKLKK